MGCGAEFRGAGWSPPSISILAEPRGRTQCLARNASFPFLLAHPCSPRTRPVHMTSPSYDRFISALKLKVLGTPLTRRQTKTVGHPTPCPAWPCLCLGFGTEVPFAEEEAGPTFSQHHHSSDSIPGTVHSPSAFPAGIGWAILLRQLPWEWAQRLPSSFQGLQVPCPGAGIRRQNPCHLGPGQRPASPTPMGGRTVFQYRSWLAAVGTMVSHLPEH